MNPKRVLDFMIACIGLAVIAIAWFYLERSSAQILLIIIVAVVVIFFLIKAVLDKKGSPDSLRTGMERIPSETDLITELVLLSEEETELSSWDLYGKTAMVIGRDVKENHVDVDLNGVAYASMIGVEHAVLNYSSGSWYIESLGNENGISIQKAKDGRKYKLSADTPCKLDKGDCIFIGLTRLLIR